MARRLLLLFFVLALSAAASATRISISEPPCDPNTDPNTIGPSALQEGFDPLGPVDGGGSFTFCNGTGVQLNSMLVEIDTPTVIPLSEIDCPSGSPTSNPLELAFFGCALATDPSDPTRIYADFFGVLSPPFASYPGVPVNSSFTIDFNCTEQDNDGNCLTFPDNIMWPDGTTTHVLVSNSQMINLPSVPEPTSMILLGSGLTAVWYRRKRR